MTEASEEESDMVASELVTVAATGFFGDRFAMDCSAFCNRLVLREELMVTES